MAVDLVRNRVVIEVTTSNYLGKRIYRYRRQALQEAMLCKLVKKDYCISDSRGYRSVWVDGTACNAKRDVIDGEVRTKHGAVAKRDKNHYTKEWSL